ncbi:MAG: hypothetical protein ACI9CU_001286 [Polaribacter sp.]|jgi:hypothetical protein
MDHVMLLCHGRKQKLKNVFSHILDLRSKEALDEQKGSFGNFNCQKGLLLFFIREGKRKVDNCDHFESPSAGVEAFTTFSYLSQIKTIRFGRVGCK